MMPTNNFGSDDSWNVWKALVVQNSIDVLPSFLQLLCSSLPSELIGLLQFLKPQLHVPNASFIRAFIGQFGTECFSELTYLRKDMSSAYKDLMQG